MSKLSSWPTPFERRFVSRYGREYTCLFVKFQGKTVRWETFLKDHPEAEILSNLGPDGHKNKVMRRDKTGDDGVLLTYLIAVYLKDFRSRPDPNKQDAARCEMILRTLEECLGDSLSSMTADEFRPRLFRQWRKHLENRTWTNPITGQSGKYSRQNIKKMYPFTV